MALTKLGIPTTTLEAGRSGEGIDEVLNYLDNVIKLDSLGKEFNKKDINPYHTIARIKVPNGASIAFGKNQQNADFIFKADLDELNFKDLETGTVIGLRKNSNLKLIVLDDENIDRADEFLEYRGNEIITKKPITPAMLTLNIKNIH